MGHGFGGGDGRCIHWHQRHVARVFPTLVFWLPRLRGVRSCGGRHGLASRLGRLGCSFVAYRFNFTITTAVSMIKQTRVHN